MQPEGGEGMFQPGEGQHSAVIVLQCLFTIPAMEGNLGSKVITNTGLFGVLDFITFSRAFILGMFLALSIAELIKFVLYPLASSNSFSSPNVLSLSVDNEHILTILKARENGMLSVT